MRAKIMLLSGFCLFVNLVAVSATEWPQFRGPTANGVTEEKLPTEWGAEKNVQWKVALPGTGWSSPIVWGDKVFVTAAVTDKQSKPRPFGSGRGGFGGGRPGAERPPGGGGLGRGGFGGGKPPDAVYRWEVHCLDRNTGKTLWKKLAHEGKPRIPTHSTNTYASETPVADGERVYAYFGMTGLFCYDFEGKLLWNKDLGSYRMIAGWGTGSSPTLEGDRLFVQCDNEEKSFLIALDKKSGNELWRVARDEKSSWSTPLVWRNKQRTELVAGGGRKIRSYDPATGKVLWELGAGDVARSESPRGRGGMGMGGMMAGSSASPVADDEMLYVALGGGSFGGGTLFAVKVGASGDLTLKDEKSSSAGIAWSRARSGPTMASPLLYRGHLYILEQRSGMLSCYDAKTGTPVYSRQRIPGATGFTSSPWAADGKVYCLDGDGQTFVIEAGPAFKVIAKNPINEMCWSSPAPAQGALLVRTVDHLYSFKQ